MSRILSLSIALIVTVSLPAQTKFQRVYGTPSLGGDGLTHQQTSDGGYIINARIFSGSCEDNYLIKTDPFGNAQWSKTYGGANCEEGHSVQQTTDGGYVMAGETASWGSGDYDYCVMKTDAAGVLQWAKTYGHSSGEAAHSVHQTTDGGFVVFGQYSSFTLNGNYDFGLVKTDAAGVMQWTKLYGTSGLEQGRFVRQTSDGGYIMTGINGTGNPNIYVVKTDVNGNLVWTGSIGGAMEDYAHCVRQTTDGGYILGGGTKSYGAGGTDAFLVKLTSNGILDWARTFGGAGEEASLSVQQTIDGGYALAGVTNSVGSGWDDLFIVKTDNMGNTQWTKAYGGSSQDGPGVFFAMDKKVYLHQTTDGGYSLTAYSGSFAGGFVYLVKTDSNGDGNCNQVNVTFTTTSPVPPVTAVGTMTTVPNLEVVATPTTSIVISNDTTVCPCPQPNAVASANVTICQGANATLSATGGTSYSWSNGASTSVIVVSPTSSASYIVTVNDSCGNDKDTVLVTVNPLPNAAAGNPSTICPGGMLTLTGSGAGSYVWSPGGQTSSSIVVSPTITTNYSLSVTNSCGTSVSTVSVTVSNSINVSVSGNTTICSGQTATLTANGGSAYSWSNGSTMNPILVSPTAATTYSVIATSGTCSDTTAVQVVVSAAPSVSVTASSITLCAGQSVTLTASGSSSYSWNTGATTSLIVVTPASSASYSVIAGSGSCTAMATYSVAVSPAISVSVTPVAICSGGTAVLSASGGNSYSWNTGATTSAISVTPTSTTNYTVQVTSGACTASAVATVMVAPSIQASISGNTTICSGGLASLTASGGSNYSWSNGSTSQSVQINPPGTGTYTYYVIATSGSCKDSVPFSVVETPQLFAIVQPFSICQPGDTAVLSANATGGTSPYTYSWSTGPTATSVIVTPSVSTNYTVTITDAAGCSTFASINVNNYNYNINAGSNTTICAGSSQGLSAFLVNPPPGSNYLWNTGATTSSINVTPVATTTYVVTATNTVIGCSDKDTVVVAVTTPPVANITGPDTICIGTAITLTGSGGGTYQWSNGQTSSAANVIPSASTTYSVVVSLGNCKDTAYHPVIVRPAPVINAGTNMAISSGQSATLSATGGGTYSWTTGQTGATIIVSPATTTKYCVIVTDAYGCSDSSCVTVSVEIPPCPEKVYLPNAFSPNEDKDNDFLMIYYGRPSCIEEFELMIFDRWGNLVFESNDPAFYWDGSYKGRKQNSAVYAYKMNVKIIGKAAEETKGNISLVR